MQKPIFSIYNLTPKEDIYRANYLSFNKTAKLVRIERQLNDALFQAVLAKVRDANVSQASYNLLSTRCMSALPKAEIDLFHDATRIYTVNDAVNKHNDRQLRNANQAVLHIPAIGTGADWRSANEDKTKRLEDDLYISVGARVMLLQNIHTGSGAVNGTIGIVRDIVFSVNQIPRQDMLQAILIELEGWTGPTMNSNSGRQVVPIYPLTAHYSHRGHVCTKAPFPLTLAHAITVHKAQGVTKSGRAVFDISRRNFAAGLTYTRPTRMKQLNHIMFGAPFGRDRFVSAATNAQAGRSIIQQRRVDEATRARQQF